MGPETTDGLPTLHKFSLSTQVPVQQQYNRLQQTATHLTDHTTNGTIFVPYFPAAQCLPYSEDIYTFTRVKMKNTEMWPLQVYCESQLVNYFIIMTRETASVV